MTPAQVHPWPLESESLEEKHSHCYSLKAPQVILKIYWYVISDCLPDRISGAAIFFSSLIFFFPSINMYWFYNKKKKLYDQRDNRKESRVETVLKHQLAPYWNGKSFHSRNTYILHCLNWDSTRRARDSLEGLVAQNTTVYCRPTSTHEQIIKH